METQIKNLIEVEVNPVLAAHNGSCELVSCDDGIAKIRLTGGCKGCPGQQMTFLNGIKPFLLDSIEGLADVVLEN